MQINARQRHALAGCLTNGAAAVKVSVGVVHKPRDQSAATHTELHISKIPDSVTCSAR
ncbi:hypothetical protein ABZY68_22860 [Streptomyces sp. NPDC006482]